MNKKGMEWTFILGAVLFVLLLIIIGIFITNAVKNVNKSQTCEFKGGTCEPSCSSDETIIHSPDCVEIGKFCCVSKKTSDITSSDNDETTGTSTGSGSQEVKFTLVDERFLPIGRFYKVGEKYTFEASAKGTDVDKCALTILYVKDISEVEDRVIKREEDFDCEKGITVTHTFSEDEYFVQEYNYKLPDSNACIEGCVKIDFIAFKEGLTRSAKWTDPLAFKIYPIIIEEMDKTPKLDSPDCEYKFCSEMNNIECENPPNCDLTCYWIGNSCKSYEEIECSDFDNNVDCIGSNFFPDQCFKNCYWSSPFIGQNSCKECKNIVDCSDYNDQYSCNFDICVTKDEEKCYWQSGLFGKCKEKAVLA
ncbi:MAG: hypothetical protein ABH828_02730 [archaeon]